VDFDSETIPGGLFVKTSRDRFFVVIILAFIYPFLAKYSGAALVLSLSITRTYLSSINIVQSPRCRRPPVAAELPVSSC
jgi:hypothetical protein